MQANCVINIFYYFLLFLRCKFQYYKRSSPFEVSGCVCIYRQGNLQVSKNTNDTLILHRVSSIDRQINRYESIPAQVHILHGVLTDRQIDRQINRQIKKNTCSASKNINDYLDSREFHQEFIHNRVYQYTLQQ